MGSVPTTTPGSTASRCRPHPRRAGRATTVGETVLYEVGDGVAVMTLNRPDRLNAIGDDLLDRLLAAVERAASDDDVRAVVLTGAGRGFCPGADIAMLAGDAAEDPSAEPEPFETRVGSTR